MDAYLLILRNILTDQATVVIAAGVVTKHCVDLVRKFMDRYFYATTAGQVAENPTVIHCAALVVSLSLFGLAAFFAGLPAAKVIEMALPASLTAVGYSEALKYLKKPNV